MQADDQPFKNEQSYKQRIDFHLFAAALWGHLAKDAMTLMEKETYSGTRANYEAFIVRALDRALDHYREADAVRHRGYKR